MIEIIAAFLTTGYLAISFIIAIPVTIFIVGLTSDKFGDYI